MTDTDKDELSRFCKDHCGLDAKETADYAGIPRRTFYDWWKSRNKAVKLMIKGIKAETS